MKYTVLFCIVLFSTVSDTLQFQGVEEERQYYFINRDSLTVSPSPLTGEDV